MGIENLQGTPWHKEQIHRSCKDGSKYCVYNRNNLCRCTASENHKRACVGKGLCEWFESKGGMPKTAGKDIYIKIVPQNSREKDVKLPAISIKKKVFMSGGTMENYDEAQIVDEFDVSEEEIQNETKNEKFIRIAEGRVTKILAWIKKLDNLSNRGNYEYTDEQVEQMFAAIDKEIAETKSHFIKSVKEEKRFKFR